MFLLVNVLEMCSHYFIMYLDISTIACYWKSTNHLINYPTPRCINEGVAAANFTYFQVTGKYILKY